MFPCYGVGDSQLGGTTCYPATEVKPVIYHDETRNPSELSKHPDREEIQVRAGKEFDQIIEQDIGVEVTPAEVREITEKGIRILQCTTRHVRPDQGAG
jgi:hypothetical protein